MNREKAKHLADKLLQSEIGREILGKELGADIKLRQTEPDPNRPIVAMLVPVYDHPEPQMQSAFAAMMRYSAPFCDLYAGPELQGSSVIHWARNFLIAELIKTKRPWTHVLFMDDDIVPPPDALVKLLSHKKDIVAAACTKRIDPPLTNFMWSYEKDGGVFFRGIQNWPENELIEVAAVGTGMMLISREALEKIADAYFLASYEKEAYGISEEKAIALKDARLHHFDRTFNAFWFRFLPGLIGADEYGEDISFCLVAKRYCDIPVFVDTSVQPGHIGKYPYSLADFIQQRDLLEKMKAEGAYKIPELDSKLKISICLPTRGRPQEIERLMRSLKDTSMIVPEVIMYVDDDDEQMMEFVRCPRPDIKGHWSETLSPVIGPRKTLTDCWNDCAKVATGDILMQGGDDIIFTTKGWDRMVANTFESHPDKFIFVHGDDGHWGNTFGTHGFVHRKWYETLGYLIPPYFSSDYGDTWLNDIANSLKRRIYLNFVTEHLHPAWGKGHWDKTHMERLERHKADKVDDLYRQLRPKLLEDVEKIREAIRNTPMPEQVPVNEMVNPNSHDAAAEAAVR